MSSKAMAMMGILTAVAVGCGSNSDTAGDSAVDARTGTGGTSGVGGITGVGGQTVVNDGGPTIGTGGLGGVLGGGTGGFGVAGAGGTSLASGGRVGAGGSGAGGRIDAGSSGGGTGTGGVSSTIDGSPADGAGSGGHPWDGGQDAGDPVIDAARDVPIDIPSVAPNDGASDAPACIDQLISSAQSAPVGYPPVSYYQCSYRGQTVYYTPPQCCDQFSKLYATDCTVICAPDGGYTGTGDGRCPDFSQSSCTLLWLDSRTH